MPLMFLLLLISLPATALETLYDWKLSASGAPGKSLSAEQVAEQLASQQVVFIGEYHGHPGNHLFQLRLLQALWRQNPDLVLTMEQFSRNRQSVIDSYLAGELGERRFIRDSDAWGNYSHYQPLVEFARSHQIPVVAANAPRDIVRCVARQGSGYLDRLPENERQWVAERLHLKSGDYQQRFYSYFTQGKPPTDPAVRSRLENRFAAQVVRDDTMAETIANALADHPGHQVVHLAGAFHLRSGQGTVERLHWRDPQIRASVIIPLQRLTAPEPDSQLQSHGDYLLLIQPLPRAYKPDEIRKAHTTTSHPVSDGCEQ